jgi:hypothetical protein
MLKKLLIILSLVQSLALWSSLPADAVFDFPSGPPAGPMEIVAAVPAATLLLPYFEVDLSNPSGANTQFSVNDASASAMLAHVTIWSDLAVPVLTFNVYLTGFDVQVINLRDVLNGKLPQTATAGQDPQDKISPKGNLSQDINFATCNGSDGPPALEHLPHPQLSGNLVADIQAALTGKASADLGGNCAGLDHGDSIARGYVTIDSVNQCSTHFPSDTGYFLAGGTGEATDQRNLWGDFLYTSGKRVSGRFSPDIVKAGGPLVHIRASDTDAETTTSGNYTFYGRYTNWTAIDNRQPLPTNFTARYTKATRSDDGTSLIVWRDPKVAQTPFTCGNLPAWYPLGQEEIVAFDEQEHPTTITGNPFGAATQRVKVGSSALPVSPATGWLSLNLNTAVVQAGSNPSVDPAAAQAWVSVIQNTGTLKSRWEPATALDSAAAAHHEP